MNIQNIKLILLSNKLFTYTILSLVFSLVISCDKISYYQQFQVLTVQSFDRIEAQSDCSDTKLVRKMLKSTQISNSYNSDAVLSISADGYKPDTIAIPSVKKIEQTFKELEFKKPSSNELTKIKKSILFKIFISYSFITIPVIFFILYILIGIHDSSFHYGMLIFFQSVGLIFWCLINLFLYIMSNSEPNFLLHGSHRIAYFAFVTILYGIPITASIVLIIKMITNSNYVNYLSRITNKLFSPLARILLSIIANKKMIEKWPTIRKYLYNITILVFISLNIIVPVLFIFLKPKIFLFPGILMFTGVNGIWWKTPIFIIISFINIRIVFLGLIDRFLLGITDQQISNKRLEEIRRKNELIYNPFWLIPFSILLSYIVWFIFWGIPENYFWIIFLINSKVTALFTRNIIKTEGHITLANHRAVRVYRHRTKYLF